MTGDRSRLVQSQVPQAREARSDDVLCWQFALYGGVLVFAAVLFLGPPIGDLLFTGRHVEILPAFAPSAHPKPHQFGRFVAAILITLLTVGALAAAPRLYYSTRRARQIALCLMFAGQLGAFAIAVWAWRGQNVGINSLTPVQFGSGDLLVAILIAAGLVLAAARGWMSWTAPGPWRQRDLTWAVVALLTTGLWLTPALFRSLNLAHAMEAVWWPLEFTYDEFMSVLNGRTPLVNFDCQYAWLLPFVTEPVFRVFGSSIAAFTTVMSTLSLLCFMCLERSLAGIARNERTALLLYVPLVAISLFTLRHAGNERYFLANYYEVMPIRYIGPCVLFWATIRHLRGLRPRAPVLLFILGGLVVINNSDFGVPALGGCLLALLSASLVPRTRSLKRLRNLFASLLTGLLGAVVIVAVFIVARTGSLPQLSRWTTYDQIDVISGRNALPTPDAGLHIIIFMTFAATLIIAAARVRSLHSDRVMTGALAFTGIFGLGASFYYIWRSFPEVLAAIFPIWGLATALLCILVLRALQTPAGRRRVWPVQTLPVAGALVTLGLFVTAADQFPAPWTQIGRITADSHTLRFNSAPGSRFVHSVAGHGESVAVLAPLGHIIARNAGVVDVSPYPHQEAIITYGQIRDVIDALRSSHGNKIFSTGILPEVGQTLTARGFRVISYDAASGLSEWIAPSPQ